MPERLWTCSAIQEFLSTARCGESATYHVGDLRRDRLEDRELARLANALFRLSEGCEHVKRDNSHERVPGTGALVLAQRRLQVEEGHPCSEYRLLVRRPCAASEIADAFATTKAPRRAETASP